MRVDFRICAAALASLAALVCQSALAHHSTAEFDYSKTVKIEGTVKEMQWTNPHSFIQLMVPGKGGQIVQWAIEIGSPSVNYGMGWKMTSVKAGDRVTMTVAPARNGKPYGTLRVVTTADGTDLPGAAARLRTTINPATGNPVKSVPSRKGPEP